MKIVLAVAALTTVFLAPRPAFACSCVNATSPCGSFATAEAVLVGSVTRVENQIAKDDDGKEFINGQVAYIQVDEAFKGVKGPELIFRSYGTSCDAVYEEDQRWLFYANYDKEHRAWSIITCGRSSLLPGAADDLLYLRGLPGSAQKTRIAGELSSKSSNPLIGVKVKIIGDRETHEVFTDKNGVYEIYGLPAGKYVIEPEIPINLKLNYTSVSSFDRQERNRRQVVLAEKSCARIDFHFTETTVIKGAVFAANGQTLRQVCVRLLPKDKPEDNSFLLNCTKDDGRFNIDEIPPGEYYLVANDDGVISSDEPFPLTYYPGVFEKEKATVLTVASGDKREDFDIRIPSLRPTRTIQGRLLFSDGRPVADESVEFTAYGENPDETRATTDAEGRFKLNVLEGSKGTVRGYMYSFSRESANCPQLDKLNKAYKDLETSRIKIELNRDHANIELVFPFPFCPKAKEKR
jgi:hypothetical protein